LRFVLYTHLQLLTHGFFPLPLQWAAQCIPV
jgi:hypothetical protein